MKLLLSILIFFIAFTARSQTQTELNARAQADYKKSEAEINRVYNLVIRQNAGRLAVVQNLRKAQRLWIQFRDAEVAAKYTPVDGGYGSAESMCRLLFLKSLTDQRINELKQWLNAQEGDVCNGAWSSGN